MPLHLLPSFTSAGNFKADILRQFAEADIYPIHSPQRHGMNTWPSAAAVLAYHGRGYLPTGNFSYNAMKNYVDGQNHLSFLLYFNQLHLKHLSHK